MKLTRSTKFATALLLVLAMLQAYPALAQDDPDPGDKPVDHREGIRTDAGILAEANRWGVRATTRYLRESRTFADLATAIAEEHPEQYGAAIYADRPGATSVIRFAGPVPERAMERIKESGLRVEVTEDAKYTDKELQDRAVRIHEHLVEAGFREVVTGITPEDGVEATVFGSGRIRLPRQLRDGTEVTRSREPIVSEEHTRGGAPLFVGNFFACTSGFTVETPSGTTGVATAGHCTNLDTYQQPSNGLTYGLTPQAEHNAIFGDFEWHTTSHVEPAEYFATATQIRDVNSVSGLLPVNTPSCVYGRSSNNRACDQVYSTFVIATVGGTTNWFLMAMDNDNTIPGDSGGPWSFSTEADGIHKGDITLGGGRRNMWSRASLLPLALGVSVRTQ